LLDLHLLLLPSPPPSHIYTCCASWVGIGQPWEELIFLSLSPPVTSARYGSTQGVSPWGSTLCSPGSNTRCIPPPKPYNSLPHNLDSPIWPIGPNMYLVVRATYGLRSAQLYGSNSHMASPNYKPKPSHLWATHQVI
jgi:hypothetical protein